MFYSEMEKYSVILIWQLQRQKYYYNQFFLGCSDTTQVLESLCAGTDSKSESRHEERQQALIELLNAGGLEHFNEDRLLKLAENAKL
jgi:hypothetical protein